MRVGWCGGGSPPGTLFPNTTNTSRCTPHQPLPGCDSVHGHYHSLSGPPGPMETWGVEVLIGVQRRMRTHPVLTTDRGQQRLDGDGRGVAVTPVIDTGQGRLGGSLP